MNVLTQKFKAKSTKNLNEYSLIEGVFNAQESKEILMNIFNSKLKFHQRKNFGVKERTGYNDVISSKRIPELQKSLDHVIDILERAAVDNKMIKIHSNILVEVIDI